MKKLVVAIVIVFGLFMLNSCDLTDKEIKELKDQYEIGQNDTKTGHEGVGDDEEEDDELREEGK